MADDAAEGCVVIDQRERTMQPKAASSSTNRSGRCSRRLRRHRPAGVEDATGGRVGRESAGRRHAPWLPWCRAHRRPASSDAALPSSRTRQRGRIASAATAMVGQLDRRSCCHRRGRACGNGHATRHLDRAGLLRITTRRDHVCARLELDRISRCCRAELSSPHAIGSRAPQTALPEPSSRRADPRSCVHGDRVRVDAVRPSPNQLLT